MNSILQIRISCDTHGIVYHTLRAQENRGGKSAEVLGYCFVFLQLPHALLLVFVDVSDPLFVEMHRSIFQRTTVVLRHISHRKSQLTLNSFKRNTLTIINELDQPAQPKQLVARAKTW